MTGGECTVIYREVGGDPAASLRVSVPIEVYEALAVVETPEGLSAVLSAYESRIGQDTKPGDVRGPREFLDCDEVATLLAWALEAHGIAYESVLGNSDEGSSHAWVRVAGKNYDPTHQGFGDGKYEVVYRWSQETGLVDHPE